MLPQKIADRRTCCVSNLSEVEFISFVGVRCRITGSTTSGALELCALVQGWCFAIEFAGLQVARRTSAACWRDTRETGPGQCGAGEEI
jgi:hypothetical protein